MLHTEDELLELYYAGLRKRYPSDDMPEFEELSFEKKRLLKNSVLFSEWQLARLKDRIEHEIKMLFNKVILVNKKKP